MLPFRDSEIRNTKAHAKEIINKPTSKTCRSSLPNKTKTASHLLPSNHKTCNLPTNSNDHPRSGQNCTSFLRTKSRIIRVSYPHSLQTPGPNQRGHKYSFEIKRRKLWCFQNKFKCKPWYISVPLLSGKPKQTKKISPSRSPPKAVFPASLLHSPSKFDTEPNDDERKWLRTQMQQKYGIKICLR